MQGVFLVFLFILGSCIGSFLCCSARRFHIKTSSSKKQKASLGQRSICLKCHYKLKWYDNIPIISWLLLRGECRKCHKKIGAAEIIAELALGIAFLTLGTTINLLDATILDWSLFVLVMILTTCLSFLAIYDGLYGELPTRYLYLSIFLSVIILIIKQSIQVASKGFGPNIIIAPLISLLILGGLYLFLYLVSKGKWVGDGDWLLGSSIGLTLASPWLAVIVLFLANLFALLYASPSIKQNKTHQIHFGPFLVTAFVAVYVFADFLNALVVI